VPRLVPKLFQGYFVKHPNPKPRKFPKSREIFTGLFFTKDPLIRIIRYCVFFIPKDPHKNSTFSSFMASPGALQSDHGLQTQSRGRNTQCGDRQPGCELVSILTGRGRKRREGCGYVCWQGKKQNTVWKKSG